MLDYLPFLIGPKSFGVIAMIIFIGSSVIIPIPMFASRGRTQAVWLGVTGFLLTAELVVLLTLAVLVSNGTIWK